MSQVDARGRVVLPFAMRRDLHLDAGSKVAFTETDEGILVRPLHDPDEVLRVLRGAIPKDAPGPVEEPLAAKRIWER